MAEALATGMRDIRSFTYNERMYTIRKVRTKDKQGFYVSVNGEDQVLYTKKKDPYIYAWLFNRTEDDFDIKLVDDFIKPVDKLQRLCVDIKDIHYAITGTTIIERLILQSCNVIINDRLYGYRDDINEELILLPTYNSKEGCYVYEASFLSGSKWIDV